MKILVTGATGFVGSVLMPKLMQKYDPKCISVFVLPGDKIPETWESPAPQIFYGDITDRDAVLKACQGHTHIIHLAGFISYWKKDSGLLEKINRDGVAAIVDACLRSNAKKLIHVSSVGALGFFEDGKLADENTPFNWPSYFHYMTSKHQGQEIVENAIREKNLPAVILMPASIMGPGDWNLQTPHNQLYWRIYHRVLIGSFAGGLGVVDVRDLVSIILKALESEKTGEKYLVVGANVPYSQVVKLVGKHARRKVYPFRLPSFLIAAAGAMLEFSSNFTGKRPLLTYSYGRLSGWKAYYSNDKSRKDFSHTYIDFEKTIRDSCDYFEKTFLNGRKD